MAVKMERLNQWPSYKITSSMNDDSLIASVNVLHRNKYDDCYYNLTLYMK